jgi:hypothetical protein
MRSKPFRARRSYRVLEEIMPLASGGGLLGATVAHRTDSLEPAAL